MKYTLTTSVSKPGSVYSIEVKPLLLLVAMLTCLLSVSGCTSIFSSTESATKSSTKNSAKGATEQSHSMNGDARESITFVAFGDTGYHYDYVETEDIVPAVKTETDFQFKKMAKWRKKRFPAEDFQPFPAHFLNQSGSYVDATGLSLVANQMLSYCQKSECDFGLMLGDNIYPDGATLGIDGFDDKQRFNKLLQEPYGSFSDLAPNFRIYATLGNHDWNTSREGALAQVEFLESNRPFYMDGLIYSVRPKSAKNQVELFVIDTEVLLASTTVYEDKLNHDGTEIVTNEIDDPKPWTVPNTQREKTMLSWLKTELKNSNARWKFVMGHHPIWSSGGSKFTQARALRDILMPTLCEYADAYFAGHEHTLEIHQDDCSTALPNRKAQSFTQILSGAGAKQRGTNRLFAQQQLLKNPQLKSIWAKGMLWGFSAITLTGNTARVDMYSVPNDADNPTSLLEYTHTFTKRTL